MIYVLNLNFRDASEIMQASVVYTFFLDRDRLFFFWTQTFSGIAMLHFKES